MRRREFINALGSGVVALGAPRFTHGAPKPPSYLKGYEMNLPEIFDREIRDHGLHTGLSGGWMMTIWLAFIITRSDHTKYKVETWVERHQEMLAMITGQVIIPQEFNDNRPEPPAHAAER